MKLDCWNDTSGEPTDRDFSLHVIFLCVPILALEMQPKELSQPLFLPSSDEN